MARAKILNEGPVYQVSEEMFEDMSFADVIEEVAFEIKEEIAFELEEMEHNGATEEEIERKQEELKEEYEQSFKKGSILGQDLAKALSHFPTATKKFLEMEGEEAYQFAYDTIFKAFAKGMHLLDVAPVYLKLMEMENELKSIPKEKENTLLVIKKIAVRVARVTVQFIRQTALFTFDVTAITLTCFARIIGNTVREIGVAGGAIKQSFNHRYSYLKKEHK